MVEAIRYLASGICLLQLGTWATYKIINHLQKTQINIYPNPATDYIQMDAEKEIQSLEILTLAGSTVKEISSPGNRIALEISPGMYIVQATVDNKILTSKLLVR